MRFIPPGGAQRRAPRRTPQAVMVEKSMIAEFPLECGHSTSRAAQELWRDWKHARGKFFCEECARWVSPVRKPKPKPLPDEPMF